MGTSLYIPGAPQDAGPRATALAASMSGETGVPSFGTQIQVLSSDPGSATEEFTTIFGVGDIDGPSRSVSETETTSHSTGVPIQTFIPSLIDPGELSFPCFWKPDDPTQSPVSPYGLENLFYSRKVTQFRLVTPDEFQTTRQFAGFVSTLGESYPVSGVCTKDTTIRISGAMAYVVAAVTLTPADNLTQVAGGGANSVAVASSSEQPWLPASTVSWITITAPTAAVTGAGTVNYTVAANGAGQPARTGYILIGDKQFKVTQAAGA